MKMKRKQSLHKEVALFAASKAEYFSQWMFDQPIVISGAEDYKIRQLQKILHKCITQLVTNYDRWSHLMPLSKDSTRIINTFRHRPYSTGSYRVDTVFDKKGQQKIIETTCRFSLNGFFNSSITDFFSKAYQSKSIDSPRAVNRYSDFITYLEHLIGDHQKIVVLRNADSRNESKYFIPIFQNAGYNVEVVRPEDINDRNDEIKGNFIVSELAIDELEMLSDETLEILSNENMINDLRTVVLIHDKRFHAVLGNEKFIKDTISEDEAHLLNMFYVPTYCYSHDSAFWKQARTNKNDWILKHRMLGKSKEIYAGPVTSEKKWDELFRHSDLKDFVIQRWIDQPRVKGTINGVTFNDFVTGTLLFFDDNYFGPGLFRTSSFPVSNRVDDRKMFGVTQLENAML